MAKSSRISRLKMVIVLKKHSDTWDLPMIELIEMVENQNTLITINYGTYFCILEFFIQSL